VCVPLDGRVLELFGVDLEDATQDDVVDHKEGDDHERREHDDVQEVALVVRLPQKKSTHKTPQMLLVGHRDSLHLT
jgi:hypothetical protein